MRASREPVTFFEDLGMDFAVRCVLSGVRNRMAEVGEVLALCERVVDGDAESWVREWHGLADRCDAIGDRAAAAGSAVSAWPAYLRAANYRSGAPRYALFERASSHNFPWRMPFTVWVVYQLLRSMSACMSARWPWARSRVASIRPRGPAAGRG